MNSLDYYLYTPAGTVLNVSELRDTTGGMYPIYYYKKESRIFCSSSVHELIKHKGFNHNPAFKFAQNIQFISGFETIDSDISRLSPFEIVLPSGTTVNFSPTFMNKDIQAFLNTSSEIMIDFVHNIERKFPNKRHIILTGGKDSRMILLIPKINPHKWHIFSSQPDIYYVKDWIRENEIVTYNDIITHDGFCDEDYEFFKTKVWASDGEFDLIHARWVKRQIEIAQELGDCVFWIGDTGIIFSPNVFCKMEDKKDYFDELLIRAYGFHGTKNQMIFNMTKCPRLTPYFAPAMLRLYENFDFSVIDRDYREDLANIIAEREIWWEKAYPNVNCYFYPFDYNIEKIYLEKLEEDNHE